jgi:hypothetical protein
MNGARLVLPALCMLAAGLAVLAGCAAEVVPRPDYHPDDRLVRKGFVFDKNLLLSDEELRDLTKNQPNGIQEKLEKTRYNRPSFLAVYRSNNTERPWQSPSGASSFNVRPADAIARLSVEHRLNPKLFLVLSQLVGQLISATSFPQPAGRVEYTFGCGCSSEGVCDAEEGGYHVQIACIAGEVRDAMDRLGRGEPTLRGWQTGKTKRSVDGVTVKPTNDATAALYDVLGEVSEGEGGAWLFAVLWSKEGWL